MKNNPNRKNDNGFVIGLCIGVSIGTTLGVMFDNIAIGVAIGVGLGLVLGTHYDSKKNKEEVDDFLKERED